MFHTERLVEDICYCWPRKVTDWEAGRAELPSDCVQIQYDAKDPRDWERSYGQNVCCAAIQVQHTDPPFRSTTKICHSGPPHKGGPHCTNLRWLHAGVTMITATSFSKKKSNINQNWSFAFNQKLTQIFAKCKSKIIYAAGKSKIVKTKPFIILAVLRRSM